jgi:hypothetical protein
MLMEKCVNSASSKTASRLIMSALVLMFTLICGVILARCVGSSFYAKG